MGGDAGGGRFWIGCLVVLLVVVFDLSSSEDMPMGARYTCSNDTVRLGNGCYFFSQAISSWHEAHFQCRDRNSQLLALETKWEDSTISSYLSRSEFAPLDRWLGGTFDYNHRRWVWAASGDRIKYTHFRKRPKLRKRSKLHEEWRCIYMDATRNFYWEHDLCFAEKHFICERPLTKML